MFLDKIFFYKSKDKNKAYSLAELAIALLAISFIVSGAFIGKALFKNARQRTVINEVESYRIAVKTFFDMFGQWPGDLTNGYNYFWSYGTAGSNPSYCNGNGDGKISPSGAQYGDESYVAWFHLSHIGLIAGGNDTSTSSGGFTGIGSGDNTLYNYNMPSLATLNTNLPQSRIPNAGFALECCGYGYNSLPFNSLTFASVYTTAAGKKILTGPVLTPKEAWYVDQKADDGMPTTGDYMGMGGNYLSGGSNTIMPCTGSTSSGSASPAALYSFDDQTGASIYDTSPECFFVIKID